MSGCSYDDTCPNCDGNLSCYSDHKPFNTESGTCISCGFYFHTVAGQDSLEELNEARKEWNCDHDYYEGDEFYLEPLTELPEIQEWLEPWIQKP